jgi:hypothetical protein
MDPQLVVPYIVSHLAAATYVFIAWRWPRAARWIIGVGFIAAGIFNIWTVSHSPGLYVVGFGPHAFPPYRRFIYGAFARHTVPFILSIACGQIAAGFLSLAPLPWRRLGNLGVIIFLLAITPLGLGAAAPSTLIFAAGVALLFRESRGATEHRGNVSSE